MVHSHDGSSLTHLAVDKVQTVVSIVLEKRFLAFEYRELLYTGSLNSKHLSLASPFELPTLVGQQ